MHLISLNNSDFAPIGNDKCIVCKIVKVFLLFLLFIRPGSDPYRLYKGIRNVIWLYNIELSMNLKQLVCSNNDKLPISLGIPVEYLRGAYIVWVCILCWQTAVVF